MKKWVADLHIHTLLSPCADIEMTPHHIVIQAAANNVDIIAITDHNVSANVPAALKVATDFGVTVWPGVEVESLEGGHVVVLFDKMRNLVSFQKILDDNMLDLKNDTNKFGNQFVVNDLDEFIREETRLLLASSKLNIESIIKYAQTFDGICIAAHVDRPSYSLLSYLGFFPENMGFSAAEISSNSLFELQENKLKKRVGNLPYVTNSDAHFMDAFLKGPKNHLYMKEPTLKEFSLALQNVGGRSVIGGQKI